VAGSIWYVHPYAGGPGVGRYDRPFHLARYWQQTGVASLVICPSFHHLMDSEQDPGDRQVEGVSYAFLKCPRYVGNGFGRILNMTVFTARLLLSAGRLQKAYGRPQAIICSSPHPYAFISILLLARIMGASSIFEVRDLWPMSIIELAGVHPSHPMVVVTGWIERLAYRRADAVVSLLPGTLEHMAERGLETDRWWYVPNGIDDWQPNDVPETSECEAFVRSARLAGKKVLIYAGAMGRPNHLESLIDAVALLKDRGHSGIVAVLVGRGELKSDLTRKVSRLGLEGSIRFFDQVPKSVVRVLCENADMGYISLRPEPLFRYGVSPNKLFDYMLASLPVVFAVRAGNDLVEEAKCGVSCDPGEPTSIADAIAELSALPAEALHALGRNGHEFVTKNHTYRALAHRYLMVCGACGPK
jgi:glycosyltransferase involved in cell wall biosynthesis